MKKRILLVASAGGHFDQALAILPAFKGHEITLVAYHKEYNAHYRDPLISHLYRLPVYSKVLDLRILFSLCVMFFQFIRIIINTKPYLIVSTGSEIAIPAFCAARLISSARLVYVETAIRINSFSQTGKILLYLSHRIYVQWPGLVAQGNKKTVFKGRVY